MLTEKERDFQPHIVHLETLIPANNFFRKLEEKLDLSFVRELVQAYYKPFGRPLIDPVVCFKLQLIMFFEDIRSERQLMEMVAMRLDHRWYIGYDLNQPVPDHSSLSKIRNRYGLAIFQRIFERIVEWCIEAGLVWGQELYFDATQVRANADIDAMVQRVNLHLLPPFDEMATQAASMEAINHSRNLVDKYDGKRIPEQKQMSSYQRDTDEHVSLTDPDASPMKPGFVGHARLGYQTHYVVDGGKARIILATLVTPASVMENTPMLDLARWSRFRWQLQSKIAVADAMYDTGYNIANLELDGLRAYIASRHPEQSQKDVVYPRRLFTFDADTTVIFVLKGKNFHTSSPRCNGKPTSIGLKSVFVINVLSKKNADRGNGVAPSGGLFIKIILTEPRVTDKRQLMKKPCENGRFGLNQSSERSSNGIRDDSFGYAVC